MRWDETTPDMRFALSGVNTEYAPLGASVFLLHMSDYQINALALSLRIFDARSALPYLNRQPLAVDLQVADI
jgi:hypothetical protein